MAHIRHCDSLVYSKLHRTEAAFGQMSATSFIYPKIVAAFRGMHVSPAKHSSASVTDGQTDGRTDDGQSDPYVLLCFAGDTKIVAAFGGMHVSPAKHSSASVTDGQTDRRTDRQTTDKVIPKCRYDSQATQKPSLRVRVQISTGINTTST